MSYVNSVTNKSGRSAGTAGTDFRKKRDRKSLFAPVDSTASFLRSQEWQDYANPEGTALGQGVQGLFGGARTASRQAQLNSSQMGLGRGFAAQQESDIRQDAGSGVAEATMGATMLGQERRMQGANMLLDSIRRSQQAAAMRRMMHRQGSMTSLFQGNFATSLGAGLGAGISQVGTSLLDSIVPKGPYGSQEGGGGESEGSSSGSGGIQGMIAKLFGMG